MIICLFQLTNDKRFARKRITPGLNHLDTGPKLKVNKTSWTSSERLMHAQFTSCDSNFLICFIIWKQCNLIFLKLSKKIKPKHLTNTVIVVIKTITRFTRYATRRFPVTKKDTNNFYSNCKPLYVLLDFVNPFFTN